MQGGRRIGFTLAKISWKQRRISRPCAGGPTSSHLFCCLLLLLLSSLLGCLLCLRCTCPKRRSSAKRPTGPGYSILVKCLDMAATCVRIIMDAHGCDCTQRRRER